MNKKAICFLLAAVLVFLPASTQAYADEVIESAEDQTAYEGTEDEVSGNYTETVSDDETPDSDSPGEENSAETVSEDSTV